MTTLPSPNFFYGYKQPEASQFLGTLMMPIDKSWSLSTTILYYQCYNTDLTKRSQPYCFILQNDHSFTSTRRKNWSSLLRNVLTGQHRSDDEIFLLLFNHRSSLLLRSFYLPHATL